jgi:hypothetical protein
MNIYKDYFSGYDLICAMMVITLAFVALDLVLFVAQAPLPHVTLIIG